MEKPKNAPEKSSIQNDKIEKFINTFLEYTNKNATLSDLEELNIALELIINHQTRIKNGMSNASTFMTMGQMEALMQDLRNRFDDASLKAFVDKMGDVKAESEIVSQKKKITSSRE